MNGGRVKKLLTVPEVAELLSVPTRTLYAWRSTRTGPPVTRVGKYLRYDPDALQCWLQEQAADDPLSRPA